MLGLSIAVPVAAIAPGRRVYAIGDVHGRRDLLDELLGLIEEDSRALGKADVTVVMLGDLIDRGPDSRGVLHRMMQGLKWADLRCLVGNHEQMMLAVLDGAEDVVAPWLQYGGRETLMSWGIDEEALFEGADIVAAAREALTVAEVAFLRDLPMSLRIDDYFFVHAGIRPGIALDEQAEEDLLWIRAPFLRSRKYHGAVVVHGHSPAPDVEQRSNRIGIDTGACWTGKLTALALEGEGRRIIQTAGTLEMGQGVGVSRGSDILDNAGGELRPVDDERIGRPLAGPVYPFSE